MFNAGALYDTRSNFGWFGFNCPKDYNITATSTPDYDVWGPDGCSWSANDWLTWHKKMVAAYGKETADNKWATAYDKASWGSKEIGYSTGNAEFKKYVIDNGLAYKSTILGKVYKAENVLDAVGQPVRNLGQVVTNVTETASTATDSAATLAKWLPWMVLAGMAVVAYLMISQKKVNVL